MLSAMSLVVSLQPFVGISDSELDWNIAAGLLPSVSPNVLSELEFKDIHSYSTGLRSEIRQSLEDTRWSLFVKGEINSQAVERGHVIDTDYFDDNRTNPYSLSISNIEGDGLLDYWVGVGASYQLIPGRLQVSVAGGGFHKEQNFNFQNGRQILAEQSYFFPTTIEDLNQSLRNDLDSEYVAEWRGYWGSIDAEFYFKKLTLLAGVRADFGTYYGEGRWNLRSNLQQPRSFTHHADSFGWKLELGANYQVTQTLGVTLSWLHGEWETDSGIDNTYFTEEAVQNPSELVQSARFNGAQWQSSQIRLGLAISF